MIFVYKLMFHFITTGFPGSNLYPDGSLNIIIYTWNQNYHKCVSSHFIFKKYFQFIFKLVRNP